jgi:hypothetical protein
MIRCSIPLLDLAEAGAVLFLLITITTAALVAAVGITLEVVVLPLRKPVMAALRAMEITEAAVTTMALIMVAAGAAALVQ